MFYYQPPTTNHQPPLERLSESNMNRAISLTQERSVGSAESGRVDQESVIDSERSERRVDSHPDSDRVCHVAEPEIADASEDIAQVVKRRDLQAAGQRITQFEIED